MVRTGATIGSLAAHSPVISTYDIVRHGFSVIVCVKRIENTEEIFVVSCSPRFSHEIVREIVAVRQCFDVAATLNLAAMNSRHSLQIAIVFRLVLENNLPGDGFDIKQSDPMC